MRRAEIWSVAARGSYTGKPRPAVIVQDVHFDATASVTICVLTTDPTEAPLSRVPVEPDALNGLDRRSSRMVDKLTTVPRTSLGDQIGRLTDEDIVRLDRAIVVFLGLGRPDCTAAGRAGPDGRAAALGPGPNEAATSQFRSISGKLVVSPC